MEEKFRYTYLDESDAEKLLDTFRLYGTENKTDKDNYTLKGLQLMYALTDEKKSFFFTQAYYQSGGWVAHKRLGEFGYKFVEGPEIYEFVYVSNHQSGLVHCEMQLRRNIEGKQYVINDLNITKQFGDEIFTELQLWDIIIFYMEMNHVRDLFLHQISIIFPDRNPRKGNFERQRKLVLKKRELWCECGELLSNDFNFEILNSKKQERMHDCIRKYGDGFGNYQNARWNDALTDSENSFYLSLASFISDAIKRCDEPDDYEYAVITENTAGVVKIWFQDGIQLRSVIGEVPLKKEVLYKAINYYKEFYYDWQCRKEL